ncbi:LacI family transcriptional regulator [Streptomyces botrytidirepellens]|uniref:LacI family transcriptional regulator n=1 Tax=Streptomyces botrytidirepellens TaxID=2486417 RepID=A0A3M8X0K5_9ACTN|nr:LacI family transcriptional regulator [Streptomyces botrytidirepellens]
MTRARGKAPTILDIAAEAGVSKSAVSRALSGQGEVSAETREKVERAARKLGYVANAMARGLVSSQTKTVGVLLRDMTRPFYALLQTAMQRAAEDRGYQVVTATSAADLGVADALRALRNLVSLQVDGLVVSSARLPSEEIVPFIDRVPIVVAGRRETSRGITSVFCDDADGGTVLAEHLLQLGHERIAVVLADEAYSLSQYARGFAMVERIRAVGKTPVVWHVATDREATQAITDQLDGAGVTAIMCPTDGSAVDALEVLRQRGQSAPEDCTVTGYDGFGPLNTPYLGLTTFRQPVEEIGRTSINLLLDKIEGKTDQDRLVELRGSLIEGRTAGRLPRLP